MTNPSLGIQWGRVPLGPDLPVFNYGATDIPAGSAVVQDTSNPVGGPTSPDYGYGVILPASDGVKIMGFAVSTIKAGQSGVIQTIAGSVAIGIAAADITIDAVLEANGSTGHYGQVQTQTSTHASVGTALATVAAGDNVPILLNPNYVA